MIDRINLNYDWKYSDNFSESYLMRECDEEHFDTVNIPHTNKELPYNNFDEGLYQFVSAYRKHFTVDEKYKGKRLVLEFEAAANYAEVYVNGVYAFSHKGGYTAFRGDITDLVEYGEDNVVAVKLDSTERSEIPPFGNVIDYLTYGGIYREVYIYVRDEVYAEEFLVQPFDVMTGEAKLDIKMNFNKPSSTRVEFALKDANGEEVTSFHTHTVESKNVSIVEDVGKIELWDTGSPVLYTLEARYGEETLSVKRGFREAVFKSDGFYLNGRLTKIVGLNRHQSYPYVGYAMPKSAQIADADFLKYNLGVNLARTSHYPNSKHFLDRCDEIGLMVFTEIPGWQYVGKDEEWREITLQHVREMIIEDFNHPSIVLWGVRINESGDDNELYSATNALAHELDKRRQTGGVRCIPRSKLLEDVYTYNDFILGDNRPLLPKFIVCKSAPYLVTEHNGHMFPTKTFDNEKKRQEHALRHAKVINAMLGAKGTSGAIGWCMSDYNTHKDFGSGDKICYHGVSDMFRVEKLAAYVYKSQQDKYPVLEITSNMEIGDNNGGMVGNVYMLTNCDEVRMYKNGVHINTFDIKELKKQSKEFRNMKHPPILLYDVIGNQIVNNTNMKGRSAENMKTALLGIKKYGVVGGIFHHPFKILGNMAKYKLSVDDITTMFGTFVTNWGGKQVTYKFEGYKNGEIVCEVEKGSVSKASLFAKADSVKLVEEDTYDVTRVVIKAVSEYGNVLPYSNDVVTLEAKGVDIIGPKTFSLIGGQRAVWVKTNGKKGKASLTIKSDIGNETIEFEVDKVKV